MSPIPYRGSTKVGKGDPPKGLEGVLISHKNSENIAQLELQLSSDRCNEVLPSGADPNQRHPRGYWGMSRSECILIKDGVLWLYDISRKQRTTEGHPIVPQAWTITTPTTYADGSPISAQDQARINANWPEIVRCIGQELSRLQERRGIPACRTGAIEIQSDRWKEKREVGLHIHFLFLNGFNNTDETLTKDGEKYLIQIRELDNVIKRVFSNFLHKEVYANAAGNVVYVNTVAALGSYMSKIGRIGSYFSKGSKALEEVRRELPIMLSGMAWATCDAETRRNVRNSVERIEIETDIRTFREQVDDWNREHEARTGRPLFSEPWQYIKEGVPYVCSLLFHVKDPKNIDYACGLLIDRLLAINGENEDHEHRATTRAPVECGQHPSGRV